MHRGKVLVLGMNELSGFPETLNQLGFDVREVTTPAEAALVALRWKPDIGLLATSQMVEFEEVIDDLRSLFPVLELEALIGVQEELALTTRTNGNGNGNGNGHSVESPEKANTIELGRISEKELESAIESAVESGTEPAITHFYTKVGNKLRRINVEEIRYIEVEGKYSAIHVGERKYNVKASLKDLLSKLPYEGFVRVSRNFVINIEHIDHIDTFQYTIRIGEKEIPISRTYKENLMRHIQML